ncbi:MAG: Gfo/Idh/MocA family oxidoreductase [Planctomycetales bacterium]|nr:Gfo/Idh/MocA family oxidoreductase [Planctomycetales bacterium]
MSHPIPVLVIGGGMIVYDQILPSLYHLQRCQQVGEITIVAASSTRLRDLAGKHFLDSFPGQSFRAVPSLESAPSDRDDNRWRECISQFTPHGLVVVATPDETHYDMVRCALEHDQHVLCVKPLVHNYQQAEELGRLAHERGLLIVIEYHKRFDRRALEARKQYRLGHFGSFACGQARMIESYYYRSSNFQNWFTADKTDAFTYVGCHYVDMVYFITGLRPVEVSCRGVDRAFPNGKIASMWTNGRVIFENGALLTVNGGNGYPDMGAGPNDQGITMYCEGDNCGAIIEHNDQFRGVGHGYVTPVGGTYFRHVNPDYFRLVPWQGDGLKPVGYGFDSIANAVDAATAIGRLGDGHSDSQARDLRQAALAHIDQQGLLATPRNSFINELVIEAARKSIVRRGLPFAISYDPPRVTPLDVSSDPAC